MNARRTSLRLREKDSIVHRSQNMTVESLGRCLGYAGSYINKGNDEEMSVFQSDLLFFFFFVITPDTGPRGPTPEPKPSTVVFRDR